MDKGFPEVAEGVGCFMFVFFGAVKEFENPKDPSFRKPPVAVAARGYGSSSELSERPWAGVP